MIKKVLFTTVLSMALMSGYAAPASVSAAEGPAPVELTDGSTAVEGDWVDSKEVNTVEESPLAQRMTQAEKAKNAEVNDKYGGAITIVAMIIVISALAILSVLFLLFGKISTMTQSRRKLQARGMTKDDIDDDHEDVDSGEVIAAISMALAEHFDARHDIEDTILTMRRIRRAYSPWSSKIYNMRHAMEPNRNPAPLK